MGIKVFRKNLAFGIIFIFFGFSSLNFIGSESIINNTNIDNLGFRGNVFYVGGNGSGNYTTIQGAINNTNVGDIVFVYGGVYYENVVIDKSISLVSVSGSSITTIVSPSDNKNTMEINANNVTINSFTIRNLDGSFVCIKLNSDQNCTISNNIIKNSDNGLYLINSLNNIINNNSIDNNNFGIYFLNADDNIIKNNYINNNSKNGIFVDSTSTNNRFYRNHFSNNLVGNAYDLGKDNWDYNSKGNYWDDYNGYDTNGDGIGDNPYFINGSGNNTDHFPLGDFLSLNQKPVAYIDSINPNPARYGDTITFIGHGSDDGYIVTWEWKLDGNIIGISGNFSTSSLSAGTHNISFRVKDNDGIWSDQVYQSLIINIPPSANFTFEPSNPYANNIIYFNSTSMDPDGVIISYYWEFGDGFSSTLQNTKHSYLTKGSYTVSLTVTDNNHQTGSVEKTIRMSTILNINLTPTDDADADCMYPDNNFNDDLRLFVESRASYCPRVSFVKYDLSNMPIDSKIINAYFKIYVYQRQSLHNLTLGIVNNLWNEDTLTWNNKPGLSYNIGLIYVLGTNQWYTWDVTKEVQKTLGGPLSFNMILENGSGDIYMFSKEAGSNFPTLVINYLGLTPENLPPFAMANGPYSGYINKQITFTAAGSTDSDGTITGYRWDFNNDGIFDTGWLTTLTTKHSFSSLGSYIVTLQVKDNYGAKNLDTCIVNIIRDTEPPPKVTGVRVTDTKDDGKLNIVWDKAIDNVAIDHYKIYRDNVFLLNRTSTYYGDSDLTNGQTYSYTISAVDTSGNEGNLSDPSIGTPTERSDDGGGGGVGNGGSELPSSIPQNIKPVANTSAGEPYLGFVNTEILFNGSLSKDSDGNITKWFWEFGDNTNGTGMIVRHTFSKTGKYTILLTVTDDEGATNTATTTCLITQPNRPPMKPTITGIITGYTNTEYNYTAVSTDLDNDLIKYTFNWNVSESQSSQFLPSGTSFTLNHSWATPGQYILTVTVTDNQTASYSNITINIKAVEKETQKTPGFEFIFIILAIALMIIWKEKRKNSV